MFRAIFGRNAAIGAVLAAVLWPSSASAQLAVVDAQANATLQLILAEQQITNAALAEQTALLTEISLSNASILAAICNSSPIGRTASSLLTASDEINFPSLPINLFGDGIVPKGFDLPAGTDVAGIQGGVKKVFGLGYDAIRIAEQAKRNAGRAIDAVNRVRAVASNPAGAVTELKGRAIAETLRRVRNARNAAWSSSMTNTLSFASYSLNEGSAAKGREGSLDLARRQSDCLREDMKAVNRTNLELLGRINHLIALQANSAAATVTTQVREAVIWADPDEGKK